MTTPMPSLADLTRQLIEATEAANARTREDLAALRELTPATTPGVKILKYAVRRGVYTIVVRPDMHIAGMFDMRVKTPEARETMAYLRNHFDGLAEVVVEAN